jgi:hypothetical protein
MNLLIVFNKVNKTVALDLKWTPNEYIDSSSYGVNGVRPSGVLCLFAVLNRTVTLSLVLWGQCFTSITIVLDTFHCLATSMRKVSETGHLRHRLLHSPVPYTMTVQCLWLALSNGQNWVQAVVGYLMTETEPAPKTFWVWTMPTIIVMCIRITFSA